MNDLLRWEGTRESLSEIFFGNSLAVGLPRFKAEAAAILSLMQLTESAPDTVVEVGVEPLQLRAGAQVATVTLSPGGAFAALLDATWDATGSCRTGMRRSRRSRGGSPCFRGFGS